MRLVRTKRKRLTDGPRRADSRGGDTVDDARLGEVTAIETSERAFLDFFCSPYLFELQKKMFTK